MHGSENVKKKKSRNLFSLIVLFAIADLTENVQVLWNVLHTPVDMFGSQGRACNVVDFFWDAIWIIILNLLSLLQRSLSS